MAIRAIATDSQDFNNPSTTGKPGRDERLDFKNEAGDTVFSIVSDADGTASIQGDAVPKVYRALLTQSSTNAPTATVLENTLGGTVVWTYNDVGLYIGTLAGAFPSATKTALPPIGTNQDAVEQATFILALCERMDEDRLQIGTYTVDPISGTQTEGDALLTNAFVQAFVYP